MFCILFALVALSLQVISIPISSNDFHGNFDNFAGSALVLNRTKRQFGQVCCCAPTCCCPAPCPCCSGITIESAMCCHPSPICVISPPPVVYQQITTCVTQTVALPGCGCCHGGFPFGFGRKKRMVRNLWLKAALPQA